MCGIFGIQPPIEERKAWACVDRLEHRGPDARGLWSDDQVQLGHRRLSILDIGPSGKQPLHDLNNRYVIVFNGEIYNFIELRDQLVAKGYRFRTQTDTEVILAAYDAWGPECLLRFNGMWAFAIWDRKESSLFLSRDRFGQKPLFYSFIGDAFVFASEMKAITPLLPELRVATDFPRLLRNIMGYEGTGDCLVKGIHRFPAGHYATLQGDHLKFQRYWNTLEHLTSVPQTYEEQVGRFRELFIDACKLRMRSDVPIGTALSGGLDSSATICAMSHIAKSELKDRMSQDWQHAFVASFPGSPFDEVKYARMVADHIQVNPVEQAIDPLDNWDQLDQILYRFEEIYITSPVPMVSLYRRVREAGVRVTIDGHGADELFSGYGHLLDAIPDTRYRYTQLKDLIETYNQTRSGFSQLPKPPSLVKSVALYHMKRLYRRYVRGQLGSRDRNHPAYSKMDHLTQSLYELFHESILPTLLRNFDRYSMASGVEIRMPFMDHRLVTYVNSLPFHAKYGEGYTKKLVRDAVADLMPHDIAYRKAKIGFNTPIVDWIQGPLKEWFLDTVDSQAFLECPIVQGASGTRKEVHQIAAGCTNLFRAEKAWKGMMPYLWYRSFIQASHLHQLPGD